MEIEKKFKIVTLPGELSLYQKKEIEQVYLCKKPTIRARKSNDTYVLTLKDKQGTKELQNEQTGIVNREIEIPLTEEAYLHLKGKADGFPVEKTRYLIPIEGGLTAELDCFHGRLEGLVFVEVEFPDTETAKQFVPPVWMGEEVSADKRYRNTYLSTLSGFDADEWR